MEDERAAVMAEIRELSEAGGVILPATARVMLVTLEAEDAATDAQIEAVREVVQSWRGCEHRGRATGQLCPNAATTRRRLSRLREVDLCAACAEAWDQDATEAALRGEDAPLVGAMGLALTVRPFVLVAFDRASEPADRVAAQLAAIAEPGPASAASIGSLAYDAHPNG